MTPDTDPRPVGALSLLVGVLVLATAVPGFASQPALAADDWPDTCLDAPVVEPGTQSGQFDSKGDRDVFAVDLDRGDALSVNFTAGVGGNAKVLLFVVNEFVMRMDRQKERLYFDVDDDAFPKYYYNHFESASFTLDTEPVKAQYRKEDSGKELFARHLVEAYPLGDSKHDFRLTLRTNEPLCIVVRMDDENAAGSWIFSYTVRESKDPSKEDLRRTLTAKNERLTELESSLAERDGRIATLEDRVATLENGSRAANDTPTPRVRTVVRTVTPEDPGLIDSFGLVGNLIAALVIGFVAFAGGLFLGFR